MRLGAPISAYSSPETWINILQNAGYRAAYCPIDYKADADTIRAYAEAAESANIIIAEVGAWSNPISPHDDERKAALEKCQKQLALADEIGALCCVNIAGSRNPEKWDGVHPDNLTKATFDLIVETTRAIIDAVNPKRTAYTLEPMPFIYPESIDSYLELIAAIDRPACAVHFDPVNLITSPQLYYNNTAFLKDAFKRLGAHIKSCHAKDINLTSELTIHLEEVVPGDGYLDYETFLSCAEALNPDMPVMLEHLPSEHYPRAANFVKTTAQNLGISL